MHMKTPNHRRRLLLFSSPLILLGLAFFITCFVAEFHKSKKSDLRLDGNLCYLPRSPAFELGFGALLCLGFAQILGNLFVCKKYLQSRWRYKAWKLSLLLMLLSWINFGMAVILIGVATSMSRSQEFGEGWLDGECYLVKDGVFVGSAFLGSLALGSTLGLGALVIRRASAEENKKIHAKVDEPTQM